MNLKKRTKILLLIGAGLLAGLLWLSLEITKEHYSFGREPPSKAIRKADMSGWNSIKVGMTKPEVLARIGTPEVERKGDTHQVEVNGFILTVKDVETWKYNWADIDDDNETGWSRYTHAIIFDLDTGLVNSKEKAEIEPSCFYWFFRRYVSKN